VLPKEKHHKGGASRFWDIRAVLLSDTRPINQWQDMLRSDYNAVSGRSGPADQYPRFSDVYPLSIQQSLRDGHSMIEISKLLFAPCFCLASHAAQRPKECHPPMMIARVR